MKLTDNERERKRERREDDINGQKTKQNLDLEPCGVMTKPLCTPERLNSDTQLSDQNSPAALLFGIAATSLSLPIAGLPTALSPLFRFCWHCLTLWKVLHRIQNLVSNSQYRALTCSRRFLGRHFKLESTPNA